MNEIVNKFLLAGDEFMHEKHLKQPALLDKSRFTYSVCLLKTKKELKNSKKQDIQTILTKIILIKPAFNMIYFMEIFKI